MCGEHTFDDGFPGGQKGSSPHVRGARTRRHGQRQRQGIIPACAGSTSCGSGLPLGSRDHPRMCGEHFLVEIVCGWIAGSSPHVRGAREAPSAWFTQAGIIPACAGSTVSAWPAPCSIRDHPRMCGEHRPFMRAFTSHTGSSPHVRGAHQHDRVRGHDSGIIPACAGSTRCEATCSCFPRDHPRMCGEHYGVPVCFARFGGSSPHVRGAPTAAPTSKPQLGIIPACAGSTTASSNATQALRDHPRMCGEHCGISPSAVNSWGSSPHVRGAHRRGYATGCPAGIIPACAGSTYFGRWRGTALRDHPRMCGEHRSDIDGMTEAAGSSPHVRGAPLSRLEAPRTAGIIPACAGSTNAEML